MSKDNIQRIPAAQKLPDSLKGGVVAIGNFDGVHRGHRAVLDYALETAVKNNVPAIVLTFEPHPRTYFGKGEPVFRLTPPKMKAGLLGKLGFNSVVEHPFNGDLSGMSPDEFVQTILIDALNVSHVVTGHDFHFGKARAGTPEFLKFAGSKSGFDVSLIDAFVDENNEIVSSSRIRSAVDVGDLSTANGLLGYIYHVQGEIVKGKQIGRDLGYPTANMLLPAEANIKHGIYAVRVMRPDGSLHDGVASYGRRPTFDNGEAILESYLFDFSGDLYGETHTVYLHSYLRGEEKFDGLDELIAQMDRDSHGARQYLSMVPTQQGLYPLYAGEQQ